MPSNPADIIPRLLAERQEILAAVFAGTHTEAQWNRLTEIRGQIDGIAAATALAARKRALDQLVADAQAMGPYE